MVEAIAMKRSRSSWAVAFRFKSNPLMTWAISGAIILLAGAPMAWCAESVISSTGKIYWTDGGTNKIQRADLDGSNVEDLVTSGLSGPRGIDVDLFNGKMYWTDNGADNIRRANLDGSNIEDLITTGLRDPVGIALDLLNGKMYWTDSRNDKIQRANLDGSIIEDLVTTGLIQPQEIDLDLLNGKMYWTDRGSDKIQRANLDGSNVEDLITTGLNNPSYIALDSLSGKMYWTDIGSNKIQRANLDGSNVEDLITTGLNGPFGISVDSPGAKIYWTEFYGDSIRRANLDGSNVENLITTGLGSPQGIVIPQIVIIDDLELTPYLDLLSSGFVGGPFTPASITYTSTNNGTSVLDWSVTWSQPWVDVSSAGGSLAIGASTTVDVSINSLALSLPAGDYTNTVTFTNDTSGVSQTRTVELDVILEKTKLIAFDGASADEFGISVAIDDNFAIVGARLDDDKGTNSGSAYIFQRSGGTWLQQAKLTASDGSSYDFFGNSVAMSGDVALVGAYLDDDDGTNSGSAYIFQRSGGTWLQQAKLTASDGSSDDNFGFSVAIEGDFAIVGAYGDDDQGSASGSAYIFQRSGGSWVEQTKLTASDGSSDDNFGWSVAISGDYALVGAHSDDDQGSYSGSAYIFQRSCGAWLEQTKLTALDGSSDDLFGLSVAMSGDYALVGAYGDDDRGSYSGSAYIFQRSGGTWLQQAKLTASDGSTGDFFGNSVAMSGDVALVGAYLDDDDGTSSGSAYIFQRSGGTWLQQTKLTASEDGAFNDYFGWSVAISGPQSIIGAYGDDDKGSDSGSAYILGKGDDPTPPPIEISNIFFTPGESPSSVYRRLFSRRF